MGAPLARPGVSPGASADIAVPRCTLTVAGGKAEGVKASKVVCTNVKAQKKSKGATLPNP